MVRFSRVGWLLCSLVSLVLANTERLAAQEPPPTAAVAPPSAAAAPPSATQVSEPQHRVRRRLTRAERRRQRQEEHARPADSRVVIGAALMIVGGVMVIGSTVPVVLPALVGGDRPDFSPSRSVVLAAGAVTLGIGTVLLIIGLSNRHMRRYAWSVLKPPTAASAAPSAVLLRF